MSVLAAAWSFIIQPYYANPIVQVRLEGFQVPNPNLLSLRRRTSPDGLHVDVAHLSQPNVALRMLQYLTMHGPHNRRLVQRRMEESASHVSQWAHFQEEPPHVHRDVHRRRAPISHARGAGMINIIS